VNVQRALRPRSTAAQTLRGAHAEAGASPRHHAMRLAVHLVEALETAKISSGTALAGSRTTVIILHPFHSSEHPISDPHP
jgi:hypothetical protein